MRLLHSDRIRHNPWQHAQDNDRLVADATTVSLARWLTERERILSHRGAIGVRLAPDDELAALLDDLPRLQLIVVEMASFTDGRVFSVIRLLRERHGFRGEIRVRGEFLIDQIDSLLRSGVDSIELPETMDTEQALELAGVDPVRYQRRPQRPQPRFRVARDGLVVH